MKTAVFYKYPPVLACIIVLYLAAALNAGVIVGTVRAQQTARPLAGVQVTIAGAGQSTGTDSAGAYALPDIAPGSYNLTFVKSGFETVVRNDVYVSGDGDVRVDADLAPGAYDLEKMVVRGTTFRKAADMAASSKVMNFDEILRQPGALADVQRAVQDLPSVASGGDNVNEVVVRGGVPGENQFIMDNIEIPNPNHFGQQGSGGGVVSLINPLLVKGLTFCAGAPPAQYGGKASSVLDVALRDGNDKMILGGVDMGIGGVGLHAEGPLWQGATFMASGAKSFLDLAATFDPSTAVPDYWGGQVKLVQHAGDHRLSLNGIYGDNGITIRNARRDLHTRGDVIDAGGFIYAGGVTAKTFWGQQLSTTITASAAGNRFNRDEITGDTTYYANHSLEQEQTLKADAAVDLSGPNRLLFGGMLRRADFNIDISEIIDTLKLYDTAQPALPGVVQTDGAGDPIVSREPRRGLGIGAKYGAYASAIWWPMDRLKLVPGVRCDGFSYTGSFTASPRLSATFTLLPALDINAAFGLQYQDPDYAQLIISDANASLAPKRAVTGIGGAEYTIDQWATKITLEGYYKRYDDLAVDSSYLMDVPYITEFTRTNALVSLGRGKSYGIELFAQKKLTDHFSGSASYSYSQAWYNDLRPGHAGAWYPADFDFRHEASLSAGWKFELLPYDWYQRLHGHLWFKLCTPIMPLADRMEISTRFRYLGGRPYTRPAYLSRYRIWGIDNAGTLNAERYAPYHRLDVRFERRYGFGFLQMIYYIDLQNIYARKNIWQYLFVDGDPRPSAIHQLPFVPAGGVIIGF